MLGLYPAISELIEKKEFILAWQILEEALDVAPEPDSWDLFPMQLAEHYKWAGTHTEPYHEILASIRLLTKAAYEHKKVNNIHGRKVLCAVHSWICRYGWLGSICNYDHKPCKIRNREPWTVR